MRGPSFNPGVGVFSQEHLFVSKYKACSLLQLPSVLTDRKFVQTDDATHDSEETAIAVKLAITLEKEAFKTIL